MKDYRKDNWKRLDDEIVGSISDKLTDVVEYLTPQRKERKRLGKPAETEEEDPYLEEIKNRRRARYEVLKEKYKD